MQIAVGRGRHCLDARRPIDMCHRSERIRRNELRIKHKWARTIATKPSDGIFFEANRRNRPKLFALLNFIQPHPGANLKWRSQNRTISQRAWPDLVFSTYPSDHRSEERRVGKERTARSAA